jgi:hypothetical protein
LVKFLYLQFQWISAGTGCNLSSLHVNLCLSQRDKKDYERGKKENLWNSGKKFDLFYSYSLYNSLVLIPLPKPRSLVFLYVEAWPDCFRTSWICLFWGRADKLSAALQTAFLRLARVGNFYTITVMVSLYSGSVLYKYTTI